MYRESIPVHTNVSMVTIDFVWTWRHAVKSAEKLTLLTQAEDRHSLLWKSQQTDRSDLILEGQQRNYTWRCSSTSRQPQPNPSAGSLAGDITAMFCGR